MKRLASRPRDEEGKFKRSPLQYGLKATDENKEIVLAMLSNGATYGVAAAAISAHRRTIIKWPDRDEEFKRRWNDAIEDGADTLEEEAIRRGVIEPISKLQAFIGLGSPRRLRVRWRDHLGRLAFMPARRLLSEPPLSSSFAAWPFVSMSTRVVTLSLVAGSGPRPFGEGVRRPGAPLASSILRRTRLVVYSIFLLALLSELLLDGPWPCPHGRVFDGDLVFEGVRAGPRSMLD